VGAAFVLTIAARERRLAFSSTGIGIPPALFMQRKMPGAELDMQKFRSAEF
jgi:hypothetical protein